MLKKPLMVWRGSRSLYIILFLFLFLQGSSQDAAKQEVDSLWWKNKTEQLDYTEDEFDRRIYNPRDDDFNWVFGPFTKYVVLFVIIIFLLFILYKLFGKDLLVVDSSTDVKEYKLLSEKDLDDRFYEMELEGLLAKSIEKKEWKMATRIQFLILLKSLIDSRQIKWHKDLTNFQIVYQLKQREDRKEMQNIVIEFEKVWYGDELSSKEVFESFKKRVSALIVRTKPAANE